METTSATTKPAIEKDLVQVAGKLGNIINQNINEEENKWKLSATVITTLKNAAFYKLLLPKTLGGL